MRLKNGAITLFEIKDNRRCIVAAKTPVNIDGHRYMAANVDGTGNAYNAHYFNTRGEAIADAIRRYY